MTLVETTVIAAVAVALLLVPRQNGTNHGTKVGKNSANRPPHLKKDRRTGIWSYIRVIPAAQRAAHKGKTSIRRSLGTSSDRFSSREFKEAYRRARAEVEAELKGSELPAIALTERDRYGLIKEMLLMYEHQGASGSPLAAGYGLALQQIEGESLLSRLQSLQRMEMQLDSQFLSGVLERIGVQLTADQQASVLKEFGEHKLALMLKRQGELQQFNFNSVGGILEQLPDAPTRTTPWSVLKQAWIDRRGGQVEVDGAGITEGTIHRAQTHWEEIQRLSSVMHPTDVTTEMVRQWIQWQKGRGLVPGTVKSNLAIIKAIWSAGVAEGLLEEDVTKTLSVQAESVDGYQPFEPKELLKIFDYCSTLKIDYQRWLPVLGLYSGARIEELSQLRKGDIREINGVRCIDIVHQPSDELPTFLKGKKGSERQVPIHPYVEKLGFWAFVQNQKDGRVFLGTGQSKATVGGTASRWHRLMLQKLDLYVERKKVFHSYRSSFKDMCRRAGIRSEVHHAFTGHSTGNVGDKSYGMTLRKMPEVTVKSIVKLPSPENL